MGLFNHVTTLVGPWVFFSYFSVREIYGRIRGPDLNHTDSSHLRRPLVLSKMTEREEVLRYGDNITPVIPFQTNASLRMVSLTETNKGVFVSDLSPTNASRVNPSGALPHSAWHIISDYRPFTVPYYLGSHWARKIFGSPSAPPPEPMRLCACVIARMPGDDDRVVLTQRIRKKKAQGATYNGMFVFPGGHVDLLPSGESETLRAAAMREFKEETGLKLREGSLKPLCTYQADLMRSGPRSGRGYFIVFFEGEVDPDSISSNLEKTFENLQREEVGKVCLLPKSCFEYFIPESLGGMGVKKARAAMKKALPVESVSVDLRRSPLLEQGETPLRSILGSGGEGTGECGLGMGHRFALRCYFEEIVGK